MPACDREGVAWPAVRFFTQGDGISIAYRELGDPQKPALMFAHCIGLDSHMWVDVVPALSADYRVILPDLRGHGASAIGEAAFEIEDLARDLISLCDHCGVARMTLIGCSIGANIAMWLAANRPERLNGVVLANGPAHLALPAAIADAVCDAARAGGMAMIARDMVNRWVSEDFRERDGGGPFNGLISAMAACPAKAFVPTFRALLRSDRTGDLPRITVPALVVAGELDAAFDGVAAARMAEAIPRAEVVVVASTAHLPALEEPATFLKHVMAFLGRI